MDQFRIIYPSLHAICLDITMIILRCMYCIAWYSIVLYCIVLYKVFLLVDGIGR